MTKLLLFIISATTMAMLSGCATFTAMSSNINASGIKEYKLINSSMCDDPKNSYLFDNLSVNATYEYLEKTDTVKVTLTNVGQKLVGGLDGSDAVITEFVLYANNTAYKSNKCDQPISNGNFDTRSRVENSLSCYFNKSIFSTITLSSQFSYKINFNQPNVGDLNTLKFALSDPTSLLYLQHKELMRLGYTYEQSVFTLWSRMPAKRFRAEVMHIKNDQKTNLVKFSSCIQTDSCQ